MAASVRPVIARELLEREDPLGAWHAFQELRTHSPNDTTILLGLAETHLMLGHPQFALAYAQRALELSPDHQQAMALTVLALLRDRDFSGASLAAERFVAAVESPQPELLAAHASSLFRLQRNTDAAAIYGRVLALQPLHAEAHLRLGSGLIPPVRANLTRALRLAVQDLRTGQLESAVERLRILLLDNPVHPVAHRLMGEALFQKKARQTMAAADPDYRQLANLRRGFATRSPAVSSFVTGYAVLAPARRAVVDLAMTLFGSHIPTLVDIGGHHDLLAETDRTTDSPFRANLRGKRTFDGRVWDDVRGIGGLRAATGIEALDEAAQHGYDTLAHEVAHQVHLYVLDRRNRARIRDLYLQAKLAGRFMDYYAASNEAEYFGQGVEAFASYGKRPGGENTHNHTRFELLRVDPQLHDLIAGLVDMDPLDHPGREQLLEVSVAVALRSGRPDDAVVAAAMMAHGPARDELLDKARRAQLLSRSY